MNMLYKFIRKDISASEFEQWLYQNHEDADLKAFLGEEFLFEAISLNFNNKNDVYNFKNKLHAFLQQKNSLTCECMFLSDTVVLDQGSEEWQQVVSTQFTIKKQDKSKWWLSLIQCRECQQFWIVEEESRVNDIDIYKRIDNEIARQIMEDNQWPVWKKLLTTQGIDASALYLIYDDECPLCRSSAHALTIKKAVGNLVLINARESHPLVSAAYARGLDPDLGIIVIYNDQYYFGDDAAHLLALLNSSQTKLNAITASLFRVKSVARFLYPIVKSIRRLLLSIKGVGAIEQNDGCPLFVKVFGNDWHKLSPFMKKRFANRPHTNDLVLVNGTMTIKRSRWMHFIKPFLKMSGGLVQQDGENIPVTVKFRSELKTAQYWFDREFKFSPTIRFKSYMLPIKDNIVVEFMRFNIGWRTKFSVDDERVFMSHHGYVFRLFKLLIPVPIGLFLGKCNVIERQISEDTFSMEMSLDHFLFGKIYEYRGTFKITEGADE
jgi:predicted DCC family thiol-disulfide oxidoreductase YuxK